MANLKVYTLPEFAELKLPPKRYIIDPFLPERGLIEIYSKTGVGKTTFAMSLAMAAALGKPFLKWGVPKRWNVLYVDGEMSPIDMQERASAAAQYFEADISEIDNFRIINRDVNNGTLPDIGEQHGQNEFDKAAQEADLIVLDNLSTLRFTGKENEADSWSVMQNWLLQMRGKSKSVIILHHAGKDGSSRGTSRRQDALDTVIKLERPYAYQQSDGAVFEVHFEKTRSFHSDAAEPVQLSHTIEDGISCWELSHVTNEKEEEVLRLIEEGMKQVDVAEAIGVSQSNVSKLLKSARAKNLI